MAQGPKLAVVTYLDRIVTSHREKAGDDNRDFESLKQEALDCDATRGFAKALRDADGLGVISEIKRRSPSKGDLNPGIDPAPWAKAYEAGGARCLSVLTDGEYFGGSPRDLAQARDAVALPVLRKDFTVSALDVLDARIMGADAVLLIAAVLDDAELSDFYQLAVEIGLDALVEIHDELEIERALEVGASLIGVNQRDLVTFEVDTARAIRLASLFTDDVVSVAESGIADPSDVPPLRDAGYRAILVGEALVRSGDPASAVRELRTAL